MRPRHAARRRVRGRRARRPRSRRLCAPGNASGPSNGGASRTTCAAPASHRSNSAFSSAADANSEWWSSSTFVTTATSAGSEKTVRSDSSPSTTRWPAPKPAFDPSCGTVAPITHAGSLPGLAQHERDHRRGRSLSVRAGDDDRRPAGDELAQELRAAHAGHGRVSRRDDRLPTVRDDRLRRDLDAKVAERLEVRGLHAVPAADLRAPRSRELRVRAETGAADPDEPEPAALHRRAIATSSSAISAAAPGRAARNIDSPICASRAGIVEQRSDDLRHLVELELRHHDRAARRDEVTCVRRLMVGGRERVRHEDRRPSGGRNLPDGRPRAGEHEVDCREGRTESVGLREHAVVVARDPASHLLEVAAARDVEDRGTGVGPRLDDQLVEGASRPQVRRTRPAPARRRAGRSSRGTRPAVAGATAPVSDGRRRAPSSRRASRAGRRGRSAGQTARPAGSRGRGERRPPSAQRGCASSPPRAPSGRRRSRRRRARRRDAAREGSAGTRAGPRPRARASGRARSTAAEETRRPGRCRARSRLQGPDALRRDPATRRTSRERRARSALPRPRARAGRDLPSPRLRSGTATAAAPPR